MAAHISLSSSDVNLFPEMTNIYFLCVPEFVLVIRPSGNSFDFTLQSCLWGLFLLWKTRTHKVHHPLTALSYWRSRFWKYTCDIVGMTLKSSQLTMDIVQRCWSFPNLVASREGLVQYSGSSL